MLQVIIVYVAKNATLCCKMLQNVQVILQKMHVIILLHDIKYHFASFLIGDTLALDIS